VIYGSVCSGIEAASVAWHPLGWKAAFFSEIDKFPSAVLAHHYPDVPNRGDMTKFKEWPDAKLDVLVGGTPCQSFSIAGLRKGLDDPRGNLMLTYLAIAARYRLEWLVWENVPGVLSSNGGKDFGTFLGGLGELGYGFAYRVLDAQFFGIPQRRRRVFVVGCLGDWRRAAAVLFERHSLSGNPPPSREAGEEITGTIGARTTAGGGFGGDFETTGGLQAVSSTGDISHCLNAGAMGRQDYETKTLIAHSLRGEGFDANEDGTGRGTPLVPVQPYTLAIRGRGDSHNLEYRQDGTANALLTPNGGRGGIGVGAIAFDCKASGQNGFGVGSVASTLRSMGHANSHQNGGGHQAVCFAQNTGDEVREMAVAGALAAQPGMKQTSYVRQSMQVRRLTPRECERLQGFPDDYCLIPYGRPGKAKLDADFLKYQLRGNPKHLTREDIDRLAKDGPRYKALGNSMAVPVMRWIGERIDAVNSIAVMPKMEVA
jgi:DNA (cytosine-5)-methyltransferase 1